MREPSFLKQIILNQCYLSAFLNDTHGEDTKSDQQSEDSTRKALVVKILESALLELKSPFSMSLRFWTRLRVMLLRRCRRLPGDAVISREI